MTKTMNTKEFLQYMKQNCVGRRNAISAKELYVLFFGSEALKNDSSFKKSRRVVKIKSTRHYINKVSNVHIVFERLQNFSFIFYIAESYDEAHGYKQKMDKIKNGIDKSIAHCRQSIMVTVTQRRVKSR